MNTKELRRYVRHARDVARQHREQAADVSRTPTQRLLATQLAEQAEQFATLAEQRLGGADLRQIFDNGANTHQWPR